MPNRTRVFHKSRALRRDHAILAFGRPAPLLSPFLPAAAATAAAAHTIGMSADKSQLSSPPQL